MASDGSSSGGSFLGGLVGGVIGFFATGFNPAGFVKGFMYGSTIGGMLAPPTGPDQFGPRLDSLTVTTSTNVAIKPRTHGTNAHRGNWCWAKDSEYVEVATTTKIKKGFFSSQKVTTYEYFLTAALFFHKGEITNVLRIWHKGGLELVYNTTSDDNDTIIASGDLAKYITIYKGTADQLPNPLIAEDVGIESCPAYRGEAYIVYNMYPLKNYQNNVGMLDPKIEYTTVDSDDAVLEFICNVSADEAGANQDAWGRLHVLTHLNADAAHLWRVGAGNSSGFSSSNRGNIYQAYPSGQLANLSYMDPPAAGGESSHNRPCAGKSDRNVMLATSLYITDGGIDDGEGTQHPYLLRESDWVVTPGVIAGSAWEAAAIPNYTIVGGMADAISSLYGPTYTTGPDEDAEAVLFSIPPVNTHQVTVLTEFAFTVAWVSNISHFSIGTLNPSLAFEGPITEEWFLENHLWQISLRVWVYDRDRAQVDQIDLSGLSSIPSPQTHYVYYKGFVYFVYLLDDIIRLVRVHHYNDGLPLQGRSASWFDVDGMNDSDPITVQLVKIGLLNDQLIFVCEEDSECILYIWDIDGDLTGFESSLTESTMTVMDAAAVLAEFGDNSSDFYNNISFDNDKMYYCLDGHVYLRYSLTGTETDLGAAPDLILGDEYPALFNIFGFGRMLAVSTYGDDMDQTGVQFFKLGAVADPDKVLLADIITAECALVGLTEDDIDVTTIDQEVRGYTVSERGSVRNVLSQLQACYPFDIIQSGYKLKFVKRGTSSVATVSWEDLGKEVSLTQDREMETQLPRIVRIKYFDKGLTYEANEQFSERQSESDNETALNIPIVFLADEAAQASDILHSIYYMERVGFAFTLPPTCRHLEPSDIITLTMKDGTTHTVRLTNINYTSTGAMECAAKRHLPTAYTSVAVGSPSPERHDTIPSIANPIAAIFDMPTIHDSQNMAGYSAVMTSLSDSWPGGQLFRTTDNGGSWQNVTNFNVISVWGTCDTILGVHGGHVIDEGGSLTVRPYNGEFETVTETQFLNEETLLVYGQPGRFEIIGYRDAEDNLDGTYTLTYLMRGRRGTEQYTGTHEVNDYFALISSSKFVGASIANLDTLIINRAITNGRELESAGNLNLTYTGVNLTPLSPVDAFAVRDVDGGIVGHFTRRSRLTGGLQGTEFDIYDRPLGEASQSYEIDVMDGDDVVRMIPTTTESFPYSDADQTADFDSVQLPLDIKIYQISAAVGRGYVGAFTI
jgi:hypothetical protein